MRIVNPSATLIHHTPDPERVIERAGRVCWRSEERITDDSHVAFIRMLKGKNHESVLEHASAGFLIVTDRGISHELVRHRIASYSQESTRYCGYNKGKFGGEIQVIRPSGVSEADAQWVMAMIHAETAYLEMLKRGAHPQEARSVLPTCLKTELVMTANFREWRHFLALRLSTAAHPDIRYIADMIRAQLVVISPNVFSEWSYSENPLPVDGP